MTRPPGPVPPKVAVETVARWLAEHYGEHPVRAIGPWRQDAAALLDLLAATAPPPPAEEAWEEGFVAASEWIASNPGPKGGHTDPPLNPYAALASPAPAPHDGCTCDNVVPRKGSGRWG